MILHGRKLQNHSFNVFVPSVSATSLLPQAGVLLVQRRSLLLYACYVIVLGSRQHWQEINKRWNASCARPVLGKYLAYKSFFI
jgi:hypothetical protein